MTHRAIKTSNSYRTILKLTQIPIPHTSSSAQALDYPYLLLSC